MNIKMESGISTVTSSSQVKSSEQSSTSGNDTNASAYDFLANLLAQMDAIVQETSQQAGQAEAATVTSGQTYSHVEAEAEAEVEANPVTIQTSLEDHYTFLNEITDNKSTAYPPEQDVPDMARTVDAFIKADNETTLPKVEDTEQPIKELKTQPVNNMPVANPEMIQQPVAKKVEEIPITKDDFTTNQVVDEEPQTEVNTKTIHVDEHDKIDVDLSQAGSLSRGGIQASIARVEPDLTGSNPNQQQEFVENGVSGQVAMEGVVAGSAQHAGLPSDFTRITNMSDSNSSTLQQAAKSVEPGQYRFDVEMPKEMMAATEGCENQSYSIKMKVYPPTLGKMLTKVTIKDGQATLKVVAENEQSRQIVLHNIQQLRDQFAESNIHLVDVDVSSSHSDERQSEDLHQFASGEIVDENIQPVKTAKKEKSNNDQLVDTYV